MKLNFKIKKFYHPIKSRNCLFLDEKLRNCQTWKKFVFLEATIVNEIHSLNYIRKFYNLILYLRLLTNKFLYLGLQILIPHCGYMFHMFSESLLVFVSPNKHIYLCLIVHIDVFLVILNLFKSSRI